MAFIYIEHHLDELTEKEAAQKLHAKYQRSTVQGSLQAHVQARLHKHYPVKRYGNEGGMIPEMESMLAVAEVLGSQQKPVSANDTGFALKQSTMPDAGLDFIGL